MAKKHQEQGQGQINQSLQDVINRTAEALSPAEQGIIAVRFHEVLFDFLADKEWDQLFKDERGISALERMAQDAIAEYERGETKEGGFGADVPLNSRKAI